MKRVLEKPFGSVHPSVAAEEAVDAAVAVVKAGVVVAFAASAAAG